MVKIIDEGEGKYQINLKEGVMFLAINTKEENDLGCIEKKYRGWYFKKYFNLCKQELFEDRTKEIITGMAQEKISNERYFVTVWFDPNFALSELRIRSLLDIIENQKT